MFRVILTPEQEDDLAESVRMLDYACCSPGAEELRRLRRDSYPVHARDQLLAATVEGRKAAKTGRVAQGRVDQFITVNAADQPDWLRYAVLETLLVWNRGWGLTCGHDPVITRPQPVFAASWCPRLVVCQYCTPMLGLPPARTAACGHCRQRATAAGLALACLQISALCYSFALCPGCADTLGYSQAVPSRYPE